MTGDDQGLIRMWTRPGTRHSPGDDDGGLPFDDLHFHRYCAVYPFVPDDDPVLTADSDTEPPVRLVRGIPRWLLRHTPMVILLVTIVFFVGAEVSPSVGGASAFIPALTGRESAVLATVGTVGILSGGLLVYIGLIDIETLYTGGIVYGLASVLLIGTIVSFTLVALFPAGELDPNIIYTSGYLLTLFFGGLLVYDGILRTEHLLVNLSDTKIINNESDYQAEIQRLGSQLDHTLIATGYSILHRRVRLPTAYAIALTVVVAAVFLWTTGTGPQNLHYPITLLGNAVLDFVMVVVAVKFLLIIKWLYQLVNRDIFMPDAPRILTYKTYHPDNHGGYRELGKLITRFNMLFIFTGLYLVYRLYVQGLRAAPAEFDPFTVPTVEFVVWFLNFAGAIVIYPFFVGTWLYYSVWQIHLRMIRERERAYTAITDQFETHDDWHIRTDGSVWPVTHTQLYSLLYGHLGPLLASALPVLL